MSTTGELKARVCQVIDLLADGAANAREINGTAKLPLTKDSYLRLLRSFAREEEWGE